MNEQSKQDERLHRLITDAIVGDDLQFASDVQIEALLDGEDAKALSDDEINRILEKVADTMPVSSSPLPAAIAARMTLPRAANTKHTDVTHSTQPMTEGISMKASKIRTARRNESRTAAVAAVVVIGICITAAGLLLTSPPSKDSSTVKRDAEQGETIVDEAIALKGISGQPMLVALTRPKASISNGTETGSLIETTARERRRVTLTDGSVLYVNENTVAEVVGDRRVKVKSGEVFVEVVSATNDDNGPKTQFVVETAQRTITTLGTKFSVAAQESGTDVLVTQGKVKVSGITEPIAAGQELLAATSDEDQPEIVPARRASQALDWMRDLIAAAETPLVPSSQFAGGSLVAIDPNGQEMKFSMRKYHVDVHIEDGFARTTIDQTYFNHSWQRLEGMFHFPLPPDASLSRLAMYVGENLMEGGMVERKHGRNVFEQIRYTKRDPALLEWVDGSTFKMRVFPLEPRQEKRIVLSYSQRLKTAYGQTHYRFPAGHSLDVVRDWSTRIRVKNGGNLAWSSPSHELQASHDGDDLILEAVEQSVKFDTDIVLQVEDKRKQKKKQDDVRLSKAIHEDHQYLMLRLRPHLDAELNRKKRNWVFLFESSGDRNPLVARVQIDVIKTLLNNAEHDDTFNIVTAGTRAATFKQKSVVCTKKNIRQALAYLEKTHLIGAFDFGKALDTCKPLFGKGTETYLIHVGSAVPVLGEKKEEVLAEQIPKRVRYIGVGVGKRWSRQFMKAAANRTGGYVTQINPDEKVAWRAFELLSVLNAPRLLDINVSDAKEKYRFLNFEDSLAEGEELAAITRLDAKSKLPKTIIVTGKLNGKPYKKSFSVKAVSDKADYLPRSWAKLEIDRLVAEGAQKNKGAIISLSKAMYVMSPFTSLLVLENDAMYKQFLVDRGRKDHWALYPAPKKIQVVFEPSMNTSHIVPVETAQAPKSANDVLKTIVFRTSPQMMAQPNLIYTKPDSYTAESLVTSQPINWSLPVVNVENLRVDFDFNVQDSIGSPDADVDGVFDLVLPAFTRNSTSVNERLSKWPIIDGFNSPHVITNDWLPRRAVVKDFFRYAMTEGAPDAGVYQGAAYGPWNAPTYNMQFFDGGWRYSPKGLGIPFPLTLPDTGTLFNRRAMSASMGIDGQPAENRIYKIQSARSLVASFKMPMPKRIAGDWDYWAEWIDGRVHPTGFTTVFTPQQTLVVNGSESMQHRIAGFEPAYRIQTSRQLGKLNINTLNQLSQPATNLWDVQTIVSSNDGLTLNTATNENLVRLWGLTSSPKFDNRLGYFYVNNNITDRDRDDVMQFHVLQDSIRELFEVNVQLDDGPIRWPDQEEWSRMTELRRRRDIDNDGNGVVDAGQDLEEFELELIDIQRQVQVQQVLPSLSVRGPGQFGWSRVIQHYQPSQFANDRGVFGDLVAHAPGMNTLPVDVLVVVGREAASDVKSTTGKIDPTARKLINAARRSRWQSITLKGRNGEPGTTIVFDGTGKYTYERTVSEGLRERVICDGDKLLHLYEELGIGARRDASRFYLAELDSLIPWLVAPAEELARGANVTATGKRAIEIARIGMADRKDKDGKPIKFAVTQLIFAKNGRLKERRLVVQPTGKVLLRTVCDAGGKVKLINADDKVIAEWNLNRALASAPDLNPDTSKLVILSLPYRTANSVLSKVKNKNDTNYADWSESDALALIAADMVSGTPQRMIQVVSQRFLNRGDERIGFQVLLTSRMHHWVATNRVFETFKLPRADLTTDPLAHFVIQYHQWIRSGKNNTEFEVGGPSEGFVQRMAAGRNLYTRWISGRANKDRTTKQVEVELNRALDYIKGCRSRQLGWALLSVLRNTVQHEELHLRVAEATKEFEKIPGLAFTVRHERARSEFKGKDVEDARALIRKLYLSIAKVGLLPPIDPSIRQEFRKGDGGPEAWNDLIRDVHSKLMEKKSLRAAILLALKSRQFGDTALGDELFVAVLDRLPEADRPDVALIAVQHLRQSDENEKADSLLSPILKDERLVLSSNLWRLAAELAEKRGKRALALARLERALDMDFRSTTDFVNLEAVRKDYGELLSRYEKLVDAAATLETEPPADLLQRVIRAADQWRSLDDDDTSACQTASRVIQKLGEKELAWDYLTTPLALRPNEASPWLSLAKALAEQKQIDLASQAYTSAFDSEATNAQILWDHAQMLKTNGRFKESRRLLKQIAAGKWQPRFQPVKQKAVQAITNQ